MPDGSYCSLYHSCIIVATVHCVQTLTGYFDLSRCHRFARSQFGVLHFGQTRGFSPFSRGSHSWPQRHRQPSSITMPILSGGSVCSCFTVALRGEKNLLEIYTTSLDRGSAKGILLVYSF